MNRPRLLALALSLGFVSPALADNYTAISNTAMSITGDIEFDDFGITFQNGKKIEFDDLLGDTFVVDGKSVPASVYSVADPNDPVLLNGNTLCGAPVTYVASWSGATENDTIVAVFSTEDAPESSDEMCASYTYE